MFYCASLVPVKDTKNTFTNPCGTGYGMFVNLKTIRGLENRMSTWHEREDVTRIAVYEFSDRDKFNVSTWHLKCFYNVHDGKIYTAIRHLETDMIIDGKLAVI